jgi:hypothetical protein
MRTICHHVVNGASVHVIAFLATAVLSASFRREMTRKQFDAAAFTGCTMVKISQLVCRVNLRKT